MRADLERRPWSGRVRPAVLIAFAPIALVIAVPLTVLESVVSLRIALLVPVLILALRAPKYIWRYVLRGPIGLFLAMAAASTLWSEQPRQTVASVGNLTLETLAAIAAVGIGGALVSRYLAAMLKIFLTASIAAAVFVPTLGRMALPGEPWKGIFVHKNSLGALAAFATVVLATSGPRVHRLRWTLVSLAVLVASDSRGGLSAAVIALFVVAAARYFYAGSEEARRYPATVFYGVIALAGAVLWQASGILLRVLGRSTDLTGRTDIWDAVVRYGSEHPWFGSGVGAQIYDRSPLHQQIEAIRGYALGTTHNGYLVVYLGLGMVGLAVFALVLLQTLRTIERHRRTRWLAGDEVLTAVGLVVCYLALNVGEDRLIARAGWFFFLFGILQLVQRRARRRPRQLTPAQGA